MKRIRQCVGAAAAALAAATGAAAPLTAPSDTVLVNQFDGETAGYWGLGSQNIYVARSQPGGVQAADEFVVPASRVWTVSRFELLTQTYARFRNLEIIIFANTVGTDGVARPGKIVSRQKAPVTNDGGGLLWGTLPAPVRLTAGTYWFSAGTYGQDPKFFWNANEVTHGASPVVRNPDASVFPACANWQPFFPICLGETVAGPGSLMFRLSGTDGS